MASRRADEFVHFIRSVWSDRSRDTYVSSTSMCFSSLLAAGRFQDVWDLLAMAPYPSWHDRRFGVEALLGEGRIDEAIAYAEASGGLNQPDNAISAMCESKYCSMRAGPMTPTSDMGFR